MRTALLHAAERSLRVAEDEQIFAQDTDAFAVDVVSELFLRTHGLPIAAHQCAARRSRSDLRQTLVLLARQHTRAPFLPIC